MHSFSSLSCLWFLLLVCHILKYTGWTQKHSLISSSYKIKTYWNIFINMGLQILHWYLAVCMFLIEHLPNKWIGCAGRNDQVLCKCPPPEITGPDRLWLFPLGVLEGQCVCTSTTHNCGWAAGTHHCSCQVGHTRYAAESLVWARLLHRCLPSNKRGAHYVCVCVCVIPPETVWIYATVVTNFVRIFQ